MENRIFELREQLYRLESNKELVHTELRDRLSRLEETGKERDDILEDIRRKVNKLHDDAMRYKGFLGAITFLGSSLVVALGFLKDYLMNHWK